MELQKTDKQYIKTKLQTDLSKNENGEENERLKVKTEEYCEKEMNSQKRKAKEKTKEMDSESFNKMTHTDLVSLGGPRVEKEREKVWGVND